MITVDSTLFYIELNLKGSINRLDINTQHKRGGGSQGAFETFTTVLLNNKDITKTFFHFVNEENEFEGEIPNNTRGLKGLFLLFPDNSIELNVKFCNVKELKTILETKKYYNTKEIKHLIIFLSSLTSPLYKLGDKPYFIGLSGHSCGSILCAFSFTNFLLATKLNYINSFEDIVFWGGINWDSFDKVNNAYRLIISFYPYNEPVVLSLLIRYLGKDILQKLSNDFPEKLNSTNIIDLDKFRSFLNSAVAEALINRVTKASLDMDLDSLDMGLDSIDEYKELFSKSQANALIFIEESIPLYYEYAARLIDSMNEDNLVKLLLDTNLAELHELDIDLDSPAKIFCIK